MNAAEDVQWTVSIETFDDLTRSTGVLERFADALEDNPRALGPAASLTTDRGVLSATFQVTAHTQGRAAELGIEAFYQALGGAGFDVDRPGWKLKIEIEPVDKIAAPA